MIEVHFSDGGFGLDIKHELGIDINVDIFLTENISTLKLVAVDQQNDIQDNTFYWFSSHNEEFDCLQIQKLIGSHIKRGSQITYNVIKI